MSPNNLFFIFFTGLTTGGLTCLALQGGLLASTIAQDRKTPSTPQITTSNFYLPVLSFLSAKLVIHTVLGFFLGALGSAIDISPITRGWLQIAIAIYLFGIAGNLLNLHPFFRYFVITPPKFFAKLARNNSKNQSLFAPALLGLLTIFLPCATTQAMEIVAIGTANPIYGAAIMFSFILGTTPSFLIFGFLLGQGSKSLKNYFPLIAGTAMYIMSIFSLNSGLGLMGSVYTIQNFVKAASKDSSPATNSVISDQIQTATITVLNSGYSPKSITLKRGVPVKLTLNTKDVQSCSRSFTIPSLNIQKLLPSTGTTTIEFTPTQTGPLAFSCSMGMYTGQFNITN